MREGPTPKLPHVGRIYFLRAIGFMAAFFFKVSNEERYFKEIGAM
jgi:hypothetical protein